MLEQRQLYIIIWRTAIYQKTYDSISPIKKHFQNLIFDQSNESFWFRFFYIQSFSLLKPYDRHIVWSATQSESVFSVKNKSIEYRISNLYGIHWNFEFSLELKKSVSSVLFALNKKNHWIFVFRASKSIEKRLFIPIYI